MRSEATADYDFPENAIDAAERTSHSCNFDAK